jgi:hypothetical protein
MGFSNTFTYDPIRRKLSAKKGHQGHILTFNI